MELDARCDRLERLETNVLLGDVVQKISLGENDDGCGAAVERKHEFALETSLIRRGRDRVQQEDVIDVGGDRVSLGALPFEARSTHECTPTGEHQLDSFGVDRYDHPITHRNIGSYVADPRHLTR